MRIIYIFWVIYYVYIHTYKYINFILGLRESSVSKLATFNDLIRYFTLYLWWLLLKIIRATVFRDRGDKRFATHCFEIWKYLEMPK